jgi:polysaccharide pyruvyl transferase WcaK-like protein
LHQPSAAKRAGSRRPDELRVGLFNVKYSPNLGDGLLSECIEAELKRLVPGLSVEAFDLAGRTDYVAGGRLRGTALRLLQSSPTPVRHGLARALLGRSLSRQRPVWRSRLACIDAAVTGGGNLFSDADLNFPLKIDAAWGELRAAGIPTAVFAVGVADNWSETGAALFRRALAGANILEASVRDARSAEIWNRRLGPSGAPRARVVHDPGLLVARHVPQVRRPCTTRRIGLGLTHPTTLRYHSDEAAVSERDLNAWYAALVRGCFARGWTVDVFTNGSPEDEAYLRRLRAILTETAPAPPGGPAINFAPRFRNPTELAIFVSGLDLLMAHRLHANIAAYSYGIPQIGFTWDVKLVSFFNLTGRSDYICTAGRDWPETVLALVERGLREGLDRRRHGVILDEVRADVAVLADTLKAGVRGNRAQPSSKVNV